MKGEVALEATIKKGDAKMIPELHQCAQVLFRILQDHGSYAMVSDWPGAADLPPRWFEPRRIVMGTPHRRKAGKFDDILFTMSLAPDWEGYGVVVQSQLQAQPFWQSDERIRNAFEKLTSQLDFGPWEPPMPEGL